MFVFHPLVRTFLWPFRHTVPKTLLLLIQFQAMIKPATPSPTTQEPAPAVVLTTVGDESTKPTLKGLKLAVLLGSITLVTFLALTDTSILGTVRSPPIRYLINIVMFITIGYPWNNYRFPLPPKRRMVHWCSPPCICHSATSLRQIQYSFP